MNNKRHYDMRFSLSDVEEENLWRMVIDRALKDAMNDKILLDSGDSMIRLRQEAMAFIESRNFKYYLIAAGLPVNWDHVIKYGARLKYNKWRSRVWKNIERKLKD